MAPPQHPKHSGWHAVTFRTKPGKGEVKVSVLNIRGPFSADTIRPAQTSKPALSSIPVRGPKPSVSYVMTQAASKRSSSKDPKTLTSTLRIGLCLNKDSVSRRTGSSTQHLIGHSPRLRPLCLSGVSCSTLRECLIITSLHHPIQKAKPGRPAVQ